MHVLQEKMNFASTALKLMAQEQGKDKRDERNDLKKEMSVQCGVLACVSHWKNNKITLAWQTRQSKEYHHVERRHWVTCAHGSRVSARRRLALPTLSPVLLSSTSFHCSRLIDLWQICQPSKISPKRVGTSQNESERVDSFLTHSWLILDSFWLIWMPQEMSQEWDWVGFPISDSFWLILDSFLTHSWLILTRFWTGRQYDLSHLLADIQFFRIYKSR